MNERVEKAFKAILEKFDIERVANSDNLYEVETEKGLKILSEDELEAFAAENI